MHGGNRDDQNFQPVSRQINSTVSFRTPYVFALGSKACSRMFFPAAHWARPCQAGLAFLLPAGRFNRSPKGIMQTDPSKSTDRVLIVEDEENARRGYEALLQKWGLDVLGVSSAEDALARFSDYHPSVLIADVELPGMDGLSLLERLGDDLASVPAIIITGKGSEERAVAAIEAGAFWYIEKPLKGAVLRALLNRALGKARDQQQVAALRRQLREAGRIGELVGAARPMQEVMRLVEQVAPSSASVLITGETGSGKEILARTLHQLSPRNDRPFVAINCSAIPESLMESEIFGHERGAFTGAAERRIGCFELADGGTLLLDEIGEMPAPTQAKLLRVLEDRKVRRLGRKVETPVDVRVLAATNKDPEQAVAHGQLRQDLCVHRPFEILAAVPRLPHSRNDLPGLIFPEGIPMVDGPPGR
jgi:DNA-binding NtrC family response regulator